MRSIVALNLTKFKNIHRRKHEKNAYIFSAWRQKKTDFNFLARLATRVDHDILSHFARDSVIRGFAKLRGKH